MKKAIKIGILSSFVLGVMACQQLPTANLTTDNHKTTIRPRLQAPANQAVKGAVIRQAKKSFSYKTTIIKHDTTANSDPCANAHDDGYVLLLKTAKQDGLDLSADRYLDEKNRLKTQFLACVADDDHPWRTYQAGDEHTKAVAKHYLNDPLSLSVVGNFHALSGEISALPSIHYRFGAMEAMINQPIVVDFKTTTLYLWADNLAFANAMMFDKELGDDWQGKWLMVSFDDDSLPRDFIKQVGKSYTKAYQTSFETGDFAYATESLPFLPKDLQDKTAYVVKNQVAKDALMLFLQDLNERYDWLSQGDIAKDDDEGKTGDDKETKQPTTSRQVVQKLFALWQKQALENNEPTDEPAGAWFYGLDDSANLLWLAKSGTKQTTLTVFDNQLLKPFERLPSNSRTPSPEDSIDLLYYFDELKQSGKESDNPYLQAIFGEQE